MKSHGASPLRASNAMTKLCGATKTMTASQARFLSFESVLFKIPFGCALMKVLSLDRRSPIYGTDSWSDGSQNEVHCYDIVGFLAQLYDDTDKPPDVCISCL
jgi:hypothetical protein